MRSSVLIIDPSRKRPRHEPTTRFRRLLLRARTPILARVTRTNTTDEFFIDAPPERIYDELIDVTRMRAWWPGARADGQGDRVAVRAPSFRRIARPVAFEARIEGRRPGAGFTWWLERGELRGRAEWWLEAFKAGTIGHYYLDVERGDRGRVRRMRSAVRRHRWAVRRGVTALKDRLEGRR